MPRDEFSPDIKRRLAQRAGYLCSICSQITVGPSDETPESVNLTGVAAHISGASPGPGSRRYDAGLTQEYRASIENGIWLCDTHADLIDGDEETYTIEYLKLIKKNHEERIKYKQSGINVEKGLITKVELCNLGKITKHTELDFAERNILYGGTGVGKTLICEFIAALRNKKYLDRWTSGTRKVNGYFIIHYFKNQPNKFSISINDKNEVFYEFNGAQIPLMISPLNIFYLRDSFWDFVKASEVKHENFLNYFADYFSLTLNEFFNVITVLGKTKKHYLNDIRINTEKDDLLVKVYSGHESPIPRFGMLSGGEQQRVIVEIALKIAEYHSKFGSTILILEQSVIPTIDDTGVNHLLETIRKGTSDFQFFMTFHQMKGVDVKGFKTYHLKRIDNEVIVTEWKTAGEDAVSS